MRTWAEILLEIKNELSTMLQKALNAKLEAKLRGETGKLYLLVDNIQQRLDAIHLKLETLQQENDALQEECMRLKNWSRDKMSYALHSLPAGTLVYRYKALTDRAAADYYLCAHCFQNSIRSILQPTKINMLGCHNCQSSIQIERR